MQNKIELKFNDEPVKNLVILEGKAAEIRQDSPFSFVSSNLNSVRKFIEQRAGGLVKSKEGEEEVRVFSSDDQYVDPTKAVIGYSIAYGEKPVNIGFRKWEDKNTIAIVYLDRNPRSASDTNDRIVGSLRLLDLKKTRVFTGEGEPNIMSLKEFQKFVRFNRGIYFERGGAADDLLNKLSSISLDFQGSIKASDDNRGNKMVAFEKKVKSEIAESISMTIPVFEGEDPMKVRVNIYFDLTEASIGFWLECPELIPGITNQATIRVNKEVELLTEMGFICLPS